MSDVNCATAHKNVDVINAGGNCGRISYGLNQLVTRVIIVPNRNDDDDDVVILLLSNKRLK